MLSLTDIKANAPSAAGLRVEARVRDYMASTLEEALAVGVEAIAGLKKLFGQQIQRSLSDTDFLELLDLEYKQPATKKETHSGACGMQALTQRSWEKCLHSSKKCSSGAA